LTVTVRKHTAEHVAFSGTGSAIDPETGVAYVYGPADTHYLRSRAQAAAFSEREDFRGKQEGFTFSVMDVLHEVTSVLTKAQCGFLLLLQCHVNFGDGRLVNSDKSSMTTDDMRRVLRMKSGRRNTFYDFLRRCTESGIIIANEDGSYAINDRYHFRGNAPIGLSVIKSYSARIKSVYGAVRPEDLGIIYRMLPLVHYATNTLCTNPGELVPERIKSLNRKELAEAIGISVGEISRRLPTLTVDGEYVIAKVSIGGTESYMFNPWIFYRKMTQPDETLRGIFRVKAR